MEIATFKAKCASCNTEFECPSFGDFSYGLFIFTTKNGRDFRYYHAIEHPITKLVEPLLPNGISFIDFVASIADSVGGESLVSHHVCPFCGSAKLSYWDGSKMASLNVPPAEFSLFLSLSGSEQACLVKKFANDARA
jgi:hypothetical protein